MKRRIIIAAAAAAFVIGATQTVAGGETAATYSYPKKISVESPADVKSPAGIKICLGVSGTDCDYMYDGGADPAFRVPVKGSAAFFGTVRAPTPDNARASLRLRNASSGCYLKTAGNPAGYLNVSESNNSIVTWDFTADFGSGASCFTRNGGATFTFYFSVTVEYDGGAVRTVPVYITNSPDAVSNLNTLKLPGMSFNW